MRRFVSRSLALVCALAGFLMGGLASAQSADTVYVDAPRTATRPAPVSTVPLPNGRGVFYYRAGTPGGVRIRSRNGTRRDTALAPPAPEAEASPLAPSVTAKAPPATAPTDGLTRLDLLELERNLIATFERRLSALERRLNRQPDLATPTPGQQAPVIVLPGQQPFQAQQTPQTPPAVALQAPAPVVPRRPEVTTTPDPSAVTPAVPETGGVTVEEIERAILDTGLFRTTTVNFEFAKAALLPVSERTLNALGAVLLRYPALRIEVGGHTDNVGSHETNDRLSQRRAESVVDYLVRAGVERSRLEAVGYGERQPVATNANETGRALNRRVEFTVLNPGAARPPSRPTGDDLRRIIREEIDRARTDG